MFLTKFLAILLLLVPHVVSQRGETSRQVNSPARAPKNQTAFQIQSGPMVGTSDFREVQLWVQTKQPSQVRIRYWDSANVSLKFQTDEVQTSSQTALTAQLRANKVEPGRVYFYDVVVNGAVQTLQSKRRFETQKLWQWRSDPPDFSVAMGSCVYVNEAQYDRPGNPYGGDYKIFESIASKSPNAMIWLGDNTYLREVDWNSRTGIEKRYTHTRSLAELQNLLSSCSNYAIWDDHDYGPNDSDRGFFNKDETLRAFKLFWANPSYGIKRDEGITTRFQWGDAEFFLLDDRWFRSPDNRTTGKRELLGESQLDWLIDGMKTSSARFKVVCIGGQVLSSLKKFENYATYEEERDRLLKRIQDERITGVFFVSGDRHHTELSKMDRPNDYPLYDLTVSPLTSGSHAGGESEDNKYRLTDTYVGQRNFAVFKFVGATRERQVLIEVFDVEGKTLWTRTVTAKELGEK